MCTRLTLDIAGLNELFEVQSNPFLPHYRNQTGIDELIDEVNALRSMNSLIVCLRLPPNASTETSVPLKQAVQQFCDQEILYQKAALRRIKRDGSASLLRGLLFLSLCFILSTLFGKIEFPFSLLSYLFTEGMIIAGWVALWDPFEMLMLNRFPHKQRIRALKILRTADWQLEQPIIDREVKPVNRCIVGGT